MIILFVVALECLLLLRKIPVCSDTANYLSHPGADSFTLSTDSLLYYGLHLLGDNHLWFQLIQLASIVIFNIAICLFGRDRLTTCFLALSPFLASIIGMHLWACAIRNGLSFSFLILSLAILELGKARSVLKPAIRPQYLSIPVFHQIFFSASATLSIALHWSTAFVLLAVLVLSSSAFATFIYKIGKWKITHKFCILAASVISLAMLFATSFAPKLEFYILDSDAIEYGRKFPFLVMVIFSIAVMLFRPWLCRRQLLKSLRGIYILSFASLLSILPLLGFNSTIIRLLIPLQGISVLYMILDSVYLSRAAILFALISLPFAAYSINAYLGAYN